MFLMPQTLIFSRLRFILILLVKETGQKYAIKFTYTSTVNTFQFSKPPLPAVDKVQVPLRSNTPPLLIFVTRYKELCTRKYCE